MIAPFVYLHLSVKAVKSFAEVEVNDQPTNKFRVVLSTGRRNRTTRVQHWIIRRRHDGAIIISKWKLRDARNHDRRTRVDDHIPQFVTLYSRYTCLLAH
jgi:hypothetical protein